MARNVGAEPPPTLPVPTVDELAVLLLAALREALLSLRLSDCREDGNATGVVTDDVPTGPGRPSRLRRPGPRVVSGESIRPPTT